MSEPARYVQNKLLMIAKYVPWNKISYHISGWVIKSCAGKQQKGTMSKKLIKIIAKEQKMSIQERWVIWFCRMDSNIAILVFAFSSCTTFSESEKKLKSLLRISNLHYLYKQLTIPLIEQMSHKFLLCWLGPPELCFSWISIEEWSTRETSVILAMF